MKRFPTAFAAACAVFISHSACAASLTMLQFGSFETRAEAQKRLTEVTAKHAAQLSKLASNIREVKLPPDNLTVYRTQAGPVESRAAAQAICSQLASVGDECYIVQTAMVSAPEKAPTLAQAAATAAAPVTATVADAADATSRAVAAVTPQLPAITDIKPTARDPLNRAALETVSADRAQETLAAAATDTRTEFSQDDAAAAQVNSALDAALNEKKADENALAAAKNSPAPSRSFWSRLNPFSDDAPVSAPAAKAPEPVSAPVEAVAATALAAAATSPAETEAPPAPAEPDAADTVPLPVPVTSAPKLETLEPKPLPVARALTPEPAAPIAPAAPAAVNLSRAPITLDTTPVILHAEPLPLPPPPAPLREQDRLELAAGIKPKLPTPEVIAASPVTAPAAAAPALRDGSVQVEEAKRVPVTNDAAATPVATTPHASPAASLSPSATDGQKTIWAQVGPFASEQAAIAYWGAYRQNHPDFPVVRVRATTPLQTTAGSKPQSWLRVGPVANAAFVTSLCASLRAQPGLRCGVVRDSGAASDIKPGKQAPASARYKH